MKDDCIKKIIPKLAPDELNTFLWNDNSVVHKHSDWEFTSTTDGKGVNIVNGTAYPLMPGDFLLLGPQHIHQFVSDTPIKRRDVCISVEKMQQIADTLRPNLYETLSHRQKPIVVKLNLETFNEIHSRLNKLDPLGQNNKDLSPILASIVYYLLGFYIEHKFEKTLPENILSFLQQISDPDVFSMRINDIIKLSSYSHSHFIKLFKTYVGKTLIEYITELRISYAARLLSSTDLNVITVSTKVGYDNQSFFARKFKEKYHVSPVEYRNSFRNNQ